VTLHGSDAVTVAALVAAASLAAVPAFFGMIAIFAAAALPFMVM
jgi:hypothetical protein